MQHQATLKTSGRAASARERSVATSLREYARGIAGGLLFSLPLLYTMEVWWAGFSTHPWRVFACVPATFLLLLGYNRYAGLRRDASFAEVAIDSIEELGLGLLIAALALWLLGRITFDMALSEIFGQIVIEAMTVAIGVSVGTAQLGSGEDEEDSGMGDDGDVQSNASTDQRDHFLGQIIIALCGAVLLAANVAPTEEIVMIAVEISSWRLIGLVLLSLALGALILFYSNFTGSQKFASTSGTFDVVIGVIITYAIALAASALILWFFGRFAGAAPIVCIAETIVLGVAATLGASAGRLLMQAGNDTRTENREPRTGAQTKNKEQRTKGPEPRTENQKPKRKT